jgi:hypothetical protein
MNVSFQIFSNNPIILRYIIRDIDSATKRKRQNVLNGWN